MGVGATCCSFSRAPRGSCSWKWTRPAAETLPFRLLRPFRFQHLPSGDLRLSLTGADLGAKECCFHCPTGLRGVYQVPSCHLWGRGVSSCLPGLVLHRGEKRPLAPFRIGYKETFARPPAPSSPGPSPPRRALPPAAGWRRGEGSRLALRAQGLAFPPGGEARSPPASPSHRAQPPGRSSPLCGRALPPLRGASRGRRHLEFCPKQGAWRRRRGEERTGGGRRREPEPGVQHGAGWRTGAAAAALRALALRRPPTARQRGRPDILGMVNTGRDALVNRLRAAQRLVLSIFFLALAFNLVSSGVCRGEDFISIG